MISDKQALYVACSPEGIVELSVDTCLHDIEGVERLSRIESANHTTASPEIEIEIAA